MKCFPSFSFWLRTEVGNNAKRTFLIRKFGLPLPKIMKLNAGRAKIAYKLYTVVDIFKVD